MKYYINSIDFDLGNYLPAHTTRFIDNMISNQNKIVDIEYSYSNDYSDETFYSFKLTSTPDVDWNDGGYWNVSIRQSEFNRIFTKKITDSFPDELFKI